MTYDFETLPKPVNRGCGKWYEVFHANAPENTVPYSVADMEFKNAPEIVDGIKSYLDCNSLGYTHATPAYFHAIANWMQRRHGFTPKKEWLFQFPGIIPALVMGVRAFTSPGDSVLIVTPVYRNFRASAENNGRKVVSSELILHDGRYEIDFADFEKKAARDDVKLCIFCNPHNPVGRVWTKEEMTKVADICLRHHVFVIDDEAHGDIIMPGYHHTSYLALDEKYRENGMICTSPNKTFNLASLLVGNIFIPNEAKRQQMQKALQTSAAEAATLTSIAYVATTVAYNQCETWLEEVLHYIDGNRQLVEDFFKSRYPDSFVAHLEGTYLMWVDFHFLRMDAEKLQPFLREKAWFFCNDGAMFGEGGRNFARINIACPRHALEEGLARLEKAIEDYRSGN